jgi:Zn-dependent peptidase ImmA (M78 family)/DNA-binding XRE family transcriptional regulator
MIVNPKMITIARESRGLSQSELAKSIGVAVSTISRMEYGYVDTAMVSLDKLSEVLNYPTDFFTQDFSIHPPNVHYRKRVNISPKIIRKADALMNIYRANIEKVLKTIQLKEANLPILNDNKYGSPKKVAAYLRSFWKVEKGPIKDLITLVEKNGIMVILFDFETDKIDGRSMMTEDGHPIIFLNRFFVGERQRMTLSHELGHIILHLSTFPTFERDEESEAFEFASEFLMPETEIRIDIESKLTIEKLSDLKRVWKVSMAGILYWSEKLSFITPNQSRYLWSQYSALGYKRGEPFQVQIDIPTLLNRMVTLYTKAMDFESTEKGIEEVAKIFKLSKEEFKNRYIAPKISLRVA